MSHTPADWRDPGAGTCGDPSPVERRRADMQNLEDVEPEYQLSRRAAAALGVVAGLGLALVLVLLVAFVAYA